jgi:hypothetical protein
MSNKPNYTPPAWLIRHHDRSVLVDEERATRFMEFRQRLCDKFGSDNEVCNPTNLFCQALDLLMDRGPRKARLISKKSSFSWRRWGRKGPVKARKPRNLAIKEGAIV